MKRTWIVWASAIVVFLALLLLGRAGLLPSQLTLLQSPLWVGILLAAWVVDAAFVQRGHAAASHEIRVPAEGLRSARVVIRHGVGKLELGGGAADGMLVDGTAMGAIVHKETPTPGGLRAVIEPGPEWPGWSGFPEEERVWRFRLTNTLPLAIELHADMSENEVDLTDVTVTEFGLDAGTSSSIIRLPAEGFTRVRIRSGAGSMRLEVPGKVAARVVVSGPLSKALVDRRFPQVEGGWESPDYALAMDRVEIDVQEGLGEVQVV